MSAQPEDFAPGWGVYVSPRRTTAREESRRRRDEFFLAQHAQQLQCEAEALGYAEEIARFFGDGEFGGAGETSRLLMKQLTRQMRAEAEHARDQPLVHGSAKAYASCEAGPDGGRCATCRGYQQWRVAANRAARRAQAWCTGTRSSYDAGCRCEACTLANTAACSRWRRSRVS